MRIYLRTDKEGTLIEPLEASKTPWDYFLECEIKYTADRLDDLINTEGFMPAVLSYLTLPPLVPVPEGRIEVPKGIDARILTGDLISLIADIPNISDAVVGEVKTQIYTYMRELWEGAENLSSEFTVHHALWAAGHVRTSILELIQDWEGRPRGRKIPVRSRRREDVRLVHASYALEWLDPPYAKEISPEILGGVIHKRSTQVLMFPWSHHGGPIRFNELIYSQKGECRRYLNLYS